MPAQPLPAAGADITSLLSNPARQMPDKDLGPITVIMRLAPETTQARAPNRGCRVPAAGRQSGSISLRSAWAIFESLFRLHSDALSLMGFDGILG